LGDIVISLFLQVFSGLKVLSNNKDTNLKKPSVALSVPEADKKGAEKSNLTGDTTMIYQKKIRASGDCLRALKDHRERLSL
jgi:hypothetical protein